MKSIISLLQYYKVLYGQTVLVAYLCKLLDLGAHSRNGTHLYVGHLLFKYYVSLKGYFNINLAENKGDSV